MNQVDAKSSHQGSGSWSLWIGSNIRNTASLADRVVESAGMIPWLCIKVKRWTHSIHPVKPSSPMKIKPSYTPHTHAIPPATSSAPCQFLNTSPSGPPKNG
ncbi:hypothetical protein APHAL10511_008270 [Amanita phalloides]|nr:hypothetical protein APHAL10511_008270 [Amanita phalloides]